MTQRRRWTPFRQVGFILTVSEPASSFTPPHTTPYISSASSLLCWPQPHSHFQRQNNVKRSWQWPKPYLVFLWADPQRSLAGLMGGKGNDSPSSVSQQSPSVCIPWIPSQGLCPLCSHFIALLITRGKKSLLFGECLKAHIHEEV